MRSLCLSLLMLLPFATLAEEAKPARFFTPQRLTVGPYDNYQGAISHDEKFLYFTRSENLASQLMKFDLEKGITETLTDKTADAKSPIPSPNGKALAFSSFRRDAKGDVCISRGGEQECLGDPGRAEQTPFWIDASHLGYVVSNDAGTEHEIWIYDLDKKQRSPWMKGLFHSPYLDASASSLVVKGRGNELLIYDWQSKQLRRKLAMPLAGSTGPARFSKDGVWLYFAQYMVDTNRDLMLDGRDAAALFRIDWQKEGAYPQQLTSLEQNCSYPFPSSQKVYVTCAFEGSLDIYAIPLTGTIPLNWEAKDLWEAHESARSYADRILLLNHLYGRFGAVSLEDFQERTLANFIFMGEFRPALFYAQIIAQAKKEPESEIEAILLDTYGRWEVLPEKNKLGGFARFLDEQERRLQPYKSYPMAQVAQAYFDFFALDESSAEAGLKRITNTANRVSFWKGRLESLLYKGKDPQLYQTLLESHVLTPGLSQETKLYYLADWLDWVSGQNDVDKLLQAFLSRLSGAEAAIVENEGDLNALIKTQDIQAQNALFQKMAKRSALYKDNAYALRLMFNRSLIRLSRAKRTRDMADVVSLYISHLKVNSKEFPYALDALRQNSLDTAYRFLRGPEAERRFALGSFYTSARMADDWESHYQYVLRQDQGVELLLTQYQQMEADGLIRPESARFVKVLVQLLDPKQKESPDIWKSSVAELEELPEQAVGVGAKYLVLGYLYQRLLETNGNAFAYDKGLAEKAHRAYLFAIDTSFGNDRILAAALQNLGLLHMRLRNYSLASAYLSKRAEYPAEGSESSLALAWITADSLAKSNRYAEAYQLLLASTKEPQLAQKVPSAVFEKLAFYAWNAGLYQEAVKSYQKYFAQPEAVRPREINLAYGFALSRAGQWDEARVSLEQVVRESREQFFQEADGPALVRQEGLSAFIAWGLLAQGRYSVQQRLEALDKRLALYPQIIDRAKLLHQSKETLQSQQIKETLDTVPLHLSQGHGAEAAGRLEEALQKALVYGEDYQYLSHTCLQSLKNAYVLRDKTELRTPALESLLAKLFKKVEAAYDQEKDATPVVTEKWLETALLAKWDEQKGKAEAAKLFAKASEDYLSDARWESTWGARKEMKQDLQRYAKALAKALP